MKSILAYFNHVKNANTEEAKKLLFIGLLKDLFKKEAGEINKF